MAHPNVEVIQRFYECFNTGDMDRLRREVLDPDVVWHLPGRHPLAGDKVGADQLMAFFQQLSKSGIQVDLIAIDAFGEDTVVEIHRGHAEHPEASLNALNCTHYRIENGKLKEVQVYIGDQHPVDNYFWTIYKLKPVGERLRP